MKPEDFGAQGATEFVLAAIWMMARPVVREEGVQSGDAEAAVKTADYVFHVAGMALRDVVLEHGRERGRERALLCQTLQRLMNRESEEVLQQQDFRQALP